MWPRERLLPCVVESERLGEPKGRRPGLRAPALGEEGSRVPAQPRVRSWGLEQEQRAVLPGTSRLLTGPGFREAEQAALAVGRGPFAEEQRAREMAGGPSQCGWEVTVRAAAESGAHV